MIFRRWAVVARQSSDKRHQNPAADIFIESVNDSEPRFFFHAAASAYAYDMNNIFHPIADFTVMDRRRG